jgi:hypothetical protein
MRSSFVSVRSLVLAILLGLTFVSNTALAAPRENSEPRFDRNRRDRIVRIIKQVLRPFGVVSASDSIAIPKP